MSAKARGYDDSLLEGFKPIWPEELDAVEYMPTLEKAVSFPLTE